MGGVGSEYCTRSGFAHTPYHELGRSVQENLFRRGDLHVILDMAAEHEPPNLSVIYAIHGVVTSRLNATEANGTLCLPLDDPRRDYFERLYARAAELEAELADRPV